MSLVQLSRAVSEPLPCLVRQGQCQETALWKHKPNAECSETKSLCLQIRKLGFWLLVSKCFVTNFLWRWKRWKEKENGMSAPWLKLNIENLCLELSRRKGFLGEVSCLQPMMQNASLGATSVLWGYDTQCPGAKEGKKKYSLPLQRWVWVPHTPEVWGNLDVDSCNLLQGQVQTGTIWMWIQIPTDFWLSFVWETFFYL